MGRVEQDVMYEWDNIPRRQTVSSFYLDETEVRNVDYLEYLFWIKRVYSLSYPEVYKKALPDTLVWRDKLGYNEPFVNGYLRHPAYQNYPVVGVSWQQARAFCHWRTECMNTLERSDDLTLLPELGRSKRDEIIDRIATLDELANIEIEQFFVLLI